MEHAVFKLKTITPLFLSGAYPQFQLNEGLRPPSIRGLLRWWFRAIAGARIGNDIEGLKQAESSIFGSTKKKSNITIRTFSGRIPSQRIKTLRIDSLSRNESKLYPHVKYFFYSMNKSTYLDPWDPTSSFDFKLSIHGSEEKVRVASALVWAMFHLGGIGLRARRGAGCMNIVEYKGNNTAQLEYTPPSADKLPDFVRNNLKNVQITIFEYLDQIKDNDETNLKRAKKAPVTSTKSSVSQYTVLSPDHSAVFLWNPKKPPKSINDWREALAKIGFWYLGDNVRSKGQVRSKNGFRMKMADSKLSNTIKNHTLPTSYHLPSTERRIFLGLPLIYAKQRAKVVVEKGSNHFERRGSPLFFGVYWTPNGYVPRIVLFNSLFLPGFSNKFVVRKKGSGDKMMVRLKQGLSLKTVLKTAQQELELAPQWEKIWGDIK